LHVSCCCVVVSEYCFFDGFDYSVRLYTFGACNSDRFVCQHKNYTCCYPLAEFLVRTY
jgi:hypothetical protein